MHVRSSASCVSSLAVTARSKETSPPSPYQLIGVDLKASRTATVLCSRVHQSSWEITDELITAPPTHITAISPIEFSLQFGV